MLIALHGGAAVAAGINRISVYGVITPTLPVDKRHIAGPTKVHCELLRLLFSCTHKILYRSGYNQTESGKLFFY